MDIFNSLKGKDSLERKISKSLNSGLLKYLCPEINRVLEM